MIIFVSVVERDHPLRLVLWSFVEVYHFWLRFVAFQIRVNLLQTADHRRVQLFRKYAVHFRLLLDVSGQLSIELLVFRSLRELLSLYFFVLQITGPIRGIRVWTFEYFWYIRLGPLLIHNIGIGTHYKLILNTLLYVRWHVLAVILWTLISSYFNIGQFRILNLVTVENWLRIDGILLRLWLHKWMLFRVPTLLYTCWIMRRGS